MSEIKKLTPKRRFAGFTDDWEQRKLGDLGTTFTGLSGKTKEDFGHGDGRFVTYMNVYNNPISDLNMVDKVEVDSKQHEVQYGDVFFTTSSETAVEVGMSSVWLGNLPNTYLNSFCFGYRPHENIDSFYLAYVLRAKSVRAQLMLLAQGISRYNISKTKSMEVLLDLPDYDEQVKIGQFFKTLDETIALHQRELDKSKALKLAYLSEMFPAEGETKPKRRFTEFTNDWQKCKFSDFTILSQGLQIAITKRYLEKCEDREFYITNEFLKENSKKKYFIEKPNPNVIANKTDILMTRTGNTGTVITGVNGAFHNNFFKVIYDESTTDWQYLFYLLNTTRVQNEIRIRSGASTIPDLSHKHFYDISVITPCEIEEQQKIGIFFKTLDDKITLQQQKLEKLKNIKEAYLNEMFI